MTPSLVVCQELFLLRHGRHSEEKLAVYLFIFFLETYWLRLLLSEGILAAFPFVVYIEFVNL